MIEDWQGEAFNQVPHSKNEIHGDQVAKDFGFKGGLVPGVTVSAYLLHPAAVAWGEEFLRRGYSSVRVNSPLYDGEQFSIDVQTQTDQSYTACLLRPDGTPSATADVSLRDATPPVRRGDAIASEVSVTPAVPESMSALRESGCSAFSYRWNSEHDMSRYLLDRSLMAPTYLDGYANPSFILGISNWVLASNAYMNPWIHMQTDAQFFAPIESGVRVVGEMQIVDLFEKKGHEFVDAEINVFNESTNECHAAIQLRAIYKLRGM